MPVVTVNVPDPKPDPLLKQLVKEFAGIAKTLRSAPKAAPSQGSEKSVTVILKQQDALVKTLERMMGMMAKMHKPKAQGMDMASFRSAMSGVADDLKSAIKSAYKPAASRPNITVKPEVKVNLGPLNKRLSEIEQAQANGMKRGRNRTFGSNF